MDSTIRAMVTSLRGCSGSSSLANGYAKLVLDLRIGRLRPPSLLTIFDYRGPLASVRFCGKMPQIHTASRVKRKFQRMSIFAAGERDAITRISYQSKGQQGHKQTVPSKSSEPKNAYSISTI